MLDASLGPLPPDSLRWPSRGEALPGCTLTRTPAPGRSRAEPATTVYVVRRKWHIDVGFAAADLGPLAFVSAEFPGAKYVFFGFGDRHYLLAKQPRCPGPVGRLVARTRRSFC